MVNHSSRFWKEADEELQELAITFEKGVEITSPNHASCFCGKRCPFAATDITYYEYTGESI